MDAAAEKQLSEGIALIRQVLEGLTDTSLGKLAELEQLAKDIQASQTELEAVNAASNKAHTDLKNTLAENAKKIEASTGELTDLELQIAGAEKELADIKKKHAEFTAYHLRAQKALDAREQSLLEREKALDEAIGQARRRASILGGIS